MDEVIALQVANMGLISNILYGPLNSSRSYSYALVDLAPKQTKTNY